MENIKILIVDDEILIAEDLKDILTGFGCADIEMAHDKRSAIQILGKNKVEVALLDIRMEKELDGLELGEHINEKYKIPFIYITAHSDIAMIKKIVKTNPIGYITKPFKKSDLFASLTMAAENIKTRKKSVLHIKDGYETILIPHEDIFYIETEGNYLNIFCRSKKHVSRQSLESLIEELDSNIFFRIHRSYIVNMLQVMRYSKKEVEINGTILPVSRNIGDEFEAKMKSLPK